jgi:dUTP pyrophosphatase
LELKIKKIDPGAKLPQRAHPHDAGIDIFSLDRTVVSPGKRVAIRTGISIEIPEGYAGLVWDKSGIAIKEGLTTIGGVIDATYRGELLIGMVNIGTTEYVFEKGHKVAQLLIQKIELVDIREVDDLSDTVRGEKGFGSTGK